MSKRTELETQLMKVVQALLHETRCKEITMTMRLKPVTTEHDMSKEDIVIVDLLKKVEDVP